MTTEQSEAEKAAEEHSLMCRNEPIDLASNQSGTSNYESFLAGAAWASAPKWVSVKEPPKVDTEIMLLDINGSYWYGYFDDGEFFYYYGREHLTGKPFTHWCELPAAPEVEK